MNEVRHPEKAGAAAADPILPWLYEQGLLGAAISTLAQGYCERLAAAGVPILRSFVGLRLLHPLYRGYGYVWRRDTPEVVEETFARNEGFGEDYLNSPILYMREHDLAMLRRRLDRPGEPEFPIYRQFRAEGAIEYLAMTAGFGKGGVADREGQGLMMSWLTDRPGGFREDEHALITRTFPAFALAMRAAVTYHTSATLAGVYLGRDAGKRVLDGEVDRGAVSRLRAVIYFADLRGFSALAEQLPGEEVVAMLDDYLDCLARPVVDRGGEVLKFLGDGVLCVFEIGPDEPHFACYVGLGAAREALRRIDALNAERRARGAPVMQAGIALHLGDVLYGNVGIEGRLDFTVIGPAVNEAARLEAECRELDRPLLVSEDFHAAADHCRDALVSLGRRQLRGITRRQEVYTLMPELFEEADAD